MVQSLILLNNQITITVVKINFGYNPYECAGAMPCRSPAQQLHSHNKVTAFNLAPECCEQAPLPVPGQYVRPPHCVKELVHWASTGRRVTFLCKGLTKNRVYWLELITVEINSLSGTRTDVLQTCQLLKCLSFTFLFSTPKFDTFWLRVQN